MYIYICVMYIYVDWNADLVAVYMILVESCE